MQKCVLADHSHLTRCKAFLKVSNSKVTGNLVLMQLKVDNSWLDFMTSSENTGAGNDTASRLTHSLGR